MKLPGYVKRTAEMVCQEVQNLAGEFGLERLGFLTLTFPVVISDVGEAQKRWKGVCNRFLAPRYQRMIVVWERHANEGIHWHAVVVTSFTMPKRFNFAAVRRASAEHRSNGQTDKFHLLTAEYVASANSALRAEWRALREGLPDYGFGRAQLEPVRSNAVGVARYFAKYATKQQGVRTEADKGARRVRFVGYGYRQRDAATGAVVRLSHRKVSTKFSWQTVRGRIWRAKVQTFAESSGITSDELLRSPNWAHRFRHNILGADPSALLAKWEDTGAMVIVAEEVRARAVARLLALRDFQRVAGSVWSGLVYGQGLSCIGRSVVPVAPWIVWDNRKFYSEGQFFGQYLRSGKEKRT